MLCSDTEFFLQSDKSRGPAGLLGEQRGHKGKKEMLYVDSCRNVTVGALWKGNRGLEMEDCLHECSLSCVSDFTFHTRWKISCICINVGFLCKSELTVGFSSLGGEETVKICPWSERLVCGPEQPVDWSGTGPVTEPSWPAARGAPRCRQYPPVFRRGGGWCESMRVHERLHMHTHTQTHTHTHTASLQWIGPSVAPPPPPSCSPSSLLLSLSKCLSTGSSSCFGSLCRTLMFESPVDENLKGRGVRKARRFCLSPVRSRGRHLPRCQTPSAWIPLTPPQTCRRGGGRWGEGGEGVPGGLYSLVTAKRLPLPERVAMATIFDSYNNAGAPLPPRPPAPPDPPPPSYTCTQPLIYTHLQTGPRVIGRLRWGSQQSGGRSWFKRGRQCPCQLTANSCVIKIQPAN